MSEVTRILSSIEQGDRYAAEQLLPLVYNELRKLAAQRLAHEKAGHTLQATALVHEAYVRLVDVPEERNWSSRGHFILIEQARHKASDKAGGKRQRVDVAEIEPAIPGPQLDLLALNEALSQLEQTDPRAAAVVKLRFFAGLTMPQAATALGVSLATAENDWAYAKCTLRLRLGDGDFFQIH
jgi:RNA polymerase sigma factor (TIGR02999 family)